MFFCFILFLRISITNCRPLSVCMALQNDMANVLPLSRFLILVCSHLVGLLQRGSCSTSKCRVIHKSVRDFRPLWYSSRDDHAEGDHVNRGRDTPSFCPTLQVLDMSTLGDAADVSPVIKFLPHTCNARVWQELDYRIDICRVTRVDISSTCKVGQKLGVSLPLLTCSPSA